MHFSRHPWWSGLVMAGLAAGCAGNGEGLNQQGEPIGSSSSSSGGASSSSGASSGGAVTADFQSIQDNVFTPICSKCHIGASAPEGLQLDAAHSYNLLVGVPSVEDSSLDRVKPGDPDSSYMVLKIEGAMGIVGGQMPLNETPLPQATIDAIRQWIMDGATNAASSGTASLARAITRAAANPFAIESTAPMDGAVVAAPFRQVVVAFTHPVDASLVNGTTVAIESDAGSVAAVAALSSANQSALLITPRTPLGPGLYRVQLRGSGPAALADVDAMVLGADVEFEFTVENAR
jgi:hypothetical protein